MGKKKTETKEVSKAQTTPQVPDWITGPLQSYLGRVQQFGQGDPSRLVPGASGLQSQAFQRAMQMAQQGGFQRPQAPPQGMGLAMIAPPSPQVMQAPQTMQQPVDPELINRFNSGY